MDTVGDAYIAAGFLPDSSEPGCDAAAAGRVCQDLLELSGDERARLVRLDILSDTPIMSDYAHRMHNAMLV